VPLGTLEMRLEENTERVTKEGDKKTVNSIQMDVAGFLRMAQFREVGYYETIS
jgi:hypothetical protein